MYADQQLARPNLRHRNSFHANVIDAAVTLPSGDNWAAGWAGTVLHFDGTQWSGSTAIAPVNFYGVFNLPAVLYLGFLNNHSIHHRGELATYLRPMGSKVPAIYSGSYDEPFQPAAAEENAA